MIYIYTNLRNFHPNLLLRHTSGNRNPTQTETHYQYWHYDIIVKLRPWRIQDFPDGRGGASSQSGCTNWLFCKFLAENGMKMEEFGPGGGRVPGALLGSANGLWTRAHFLETKKQIDHTYLHTLPKLSLQLNMLQKISQI